MLSFALWLNEGMACAYQIIVSLCELQLGSLFYYCTDYSYISFFTGRKPEQTISLAWSFRGLEIVAHSVIVREYGGGCTDLCAHVTDGCHAYGREQRNLNIERDYTITVSKSSHYSALMPEIMFCLYLPVQEMESTPGP